MNVLIIFDIWRFIKLLPALTRYIKVLVIKLYLKQVFQILKFTDKFLEKVNQETLPQFSKVNSISMILLKQRFTSM